MLNLTQIAADQCASCSYETSIFRKSFDHARDSDAGVISAPTPVTASPEFVGPKMR
jgi:hypothetical protein